MSEAHPSAPAGGRAAVRAALAGEYRAHRPLWLGMSALFYALAFSWPGSAAEAAARLAGVSALLFVLFAAALCLVYKSTAQNALALSETERPGFLSGARRALLAAALAAAAFLAAAAALLAAAAALIH